MITGSKECCVIESWNKFIRLELDLAGRRNSTIKTSLFNSGGRPKRHALSAALSHQEIFE